MALTVSVISFLVLFGELPSYQGTIVARSRRKLIKAWHYVLDEFETLDLRYFNGKLTAMSGAMAWMVGWIVPVFYATLMGACAAAFIETTFPQLVQYDPRWSKQFYLVVIPSLVANFGSFTLGTFCDPGKINSRCDMEKITVQFPYDELIFFKGMECRTCRLPKPARSKHCSVSGHCVLLFDHYCVWLNNAVGYYNYRWFFAFLVSICWTLLYGGYMCWQAIHLYMTHENMDMITTTSTLARWWLTITQTTYPNRITGMLLILCCFLLPVVAAFLGEHLWLIYLGVTTNESAKWDYIKYLLSQGLLYRSGTTYISMMCAGDWNGPAGFVRLRDGSEYTDLRDGGDLVKIEGWDQLDNIYDDGFWNNLKQRLFPVKCTF